MLPTQTESSSQPPVPPVPSPHPVNYWRSKRVIFSIIGITVLILFFAAFFFSTSTKSTKSTKSPTKPKTSTQNKQLPKTWEIVFSFDTQMQKLSVKSVAIGEGNAPASPLALSPYKLLVLDGTKHTLFETHIHITEQIIYNVDYTPGATSSASFPTLPPTLESIVTVPYFAKGERIQVTKNDELILEFKPPKKISMHIIPEVYAQPACNALHVVFLSDGYSDLAKYQREVQSFIVAFKATEPYASNSDIFDFKVVENASEPLGCNKGGVLYTNCLGSAVTLSKIQNLAITSYPDLPRGPDLKYLILVDGAPEPMGFGGSILGASSNIGGNVGVFQTQVAALGTAVHEFEGHMAGWLYDRYVHVNPRYGQLVGVIRSNCTGSESGEAFWSLAGGAGSFQGCANMNNYAPTQYTCPGRVGLISGGDPNTIMSAGGCATTAGFDSVERYWIEHEILPKYQSCPSEAPTETPMPTGEASPTPSEFEISPTPETTGGAVPPSYTPTPSRSPTPTPIPYTCREGEGTTSTTGLQLKTLICEPKQ